MVRQAVESGDYASNSEIVREALRDWKLKRALQQQDVEGAAPPVAGRAFTAARAGSPGMADLKAEARRRLEAQSQPGVEATCPSSRERRRPTKTRSISGFTSPRQPRCRRSPARRVRKEVRAAGWAARLGAARSDIAPELRHFPAGNYLILYRETDDGIEVVRVVHGARWLSNLFLTTPGQALIGYASASPFSANSASPTSFQCAQRPGSSVLAAARSKPSNSPRLRWAKPARSNNTPAESADGRGSCALPWRTGAYWTGSTWPPPRGPERRGRWPVPSGNQGRQQLVIRRRAVGFSVQHQTTAGFGESLSLQQRHPVRQPLIAVHVGSLYPIHRIAARRHRNPSRRPPRSLAPLSRSGNGGVSRARW